MGSENITDNILTTIKKMLGISDDDTAFDTDIVININTVFAILYQLGIGPEGFKLQTKDETWSDYLQDETLLEDVKTYIYLKVRLIFDPPLNSSHLESIKQLISELEFRLNIKEKDEVKDDE